MCPRQECALSSLQYNASLVKKDINLLFVILAYNETQAFSIHCVKIRPRMAVA